MDRLVLPHDRGQLTQPHGRSGGTTSGRRRDAPWGEALTQVGSRTPWSRADQGRVHHLPPEPDSSPRRRLERSIHVPNPTPGRHRAPGRPALSPSCRHAVSRSAKPIGKVSAVLAVSGGLVASFSLPASASPLSKQAKPAVAPRRCGAGAGRRGRLAAASSRAAVVSPTFGEIGFTGVVKPKPQAEAARRSRSSWPSGRGRERAVAQPSRSTERSSRRSSSSTPSQQPPATRAAPSAGSPPGSAGPVGSRVVRRPGHRGEPGRHPLRLRRHHAGRLRLLGLHPVGLRARSAGACRAPPRPSAQAATPVSRPAAR